MAASAMSSTMPGAAGPAGTGCSASRSPSTTPTVSRLASRLNGAPPIGARLSRETAMSGAPPSPFDSAGTTKRRTAGRISRSGNSAGRAISVSLLSARMATRTIGMTAPDVTGPSKNAGAVPGTSFLSSLSGCCYERRAEKSRDSPWTECRDPLPVEGAGRADQHPARGRVDEAHPDLGAGVPPVAAAAGDDLDVAARAGEHGLHHRSRRFRDAQVIKDFGQRGAGPQPLVGPGPDAHRHAELVESRGRPLRQTNTQDRNEPARVVNVHGGERDQLRSAQGHNRLGGPTGGAGTLRDDAAQQFAGAVRRGILLGARVAQVEPPVGKAHRPDPVGDHRVDRSVLRHQAHPGQFGPLALEERPPLRGIAIRRGDRQDPREAARPNGFRNEPRVIDRQLHGVGFGTHPGRINRPIWRLRPCRGRTSPACWLHACWPSTDRTAPEPPSPGSTAPATPGRSYRCRPARRWTARPARWRYRRPGPEGCRHSPTCPPRGPASPGSCT